MSRCSGRELPKGCEEVFPFALLAVKVWSLAGPGPSELPNFCEALSPSASLFENVCLGIADCWPGRVRGVATGCTVSGRATAELGFLKATSLPVSSVCLVQHTITMRITGEQLTDVRSIPNKNLSLIVGACVRTGKPASLLGPSALM